MQIIVPFLIKKMLLKVIINTFFVSVSTNDTYDQLDETSSNALCGHQLFEFFLYLK